MDPAGALTIAQGNYGSKTMLKLCRQPQFLQSGWGDLNSRPLNRQSRNWRPERYERRSEWLREKPEEVRTTPERDGRQVLRGGGLRPFVSGSRGSLRVSGSRGSRRGPRGSGVLGSGLGGGCGSGLDGGCGSSFVVSSAIFGLFLLDGQLQEPQKQCGP